MKNRRYRAIKVTAVVVSSLLLLLLLTVAIVATILLSPNRLTQIAQTAVEEYIPCKTTFRRAELTILSSYPFLGFELEGLVVNDEMESSISDTLFSCNSLKFTINIADFIKKGDIIVTSFQCKGVDLNIYTDRNGRSNLYRITEADSIVSPEIDSTPSASIEQTLNSLENLYADIKRATIKGLNINYVDRFSNIEAKLSHTDIELTASAVGQEIVANLQLTLQELSAHLTDTLPYSANIQNLTLVTNLSLSDKIVGGVVYANLQGASVGVNGEQLLQANKLFANLENLEFHPLQGSLSLSPKIGATEIDYNTDGIGATLLDPIFSIAEAVYSGDSIKASALRIGSRRVDLSLTDTLSTSLANISDINIFGDIAADTSLHTIVTELALHSTNVDLSMHGEESINGSIYMPHLALRATLDGSSIALTPTFSTQNIVVNVDGCNYLNNWPLSCSLPLVTDTAFHYFNLKPGTYIALNGEQVNLHGSVNIANPDNIVGDVAITLNDAHLPTLISMIPSSLQSYVAGVNLRGDANISLYAAAALQQGVFDIESALATIDCRNLDVNYCDSLSATSKYIEAKISYPSANRVAAQSNGSADIAITATDLWTEIVDTTSMLDVSLQGGDAKFTLSNLLDSITPISFQGTIMADIIDGSMDTLSLQIEGAVIDCSLTTINSQPRAMANIEYRQLLAKAGSNISATTQNSSLLAIATYNSQATELLHQWDPIIRFSMQQANLSLLEEPIEIPLLEFDFSLGEFNITDSRIVLGESDIMLWGSIYNIGPFLDNTGLLTGELFLESDYANVTELLYLVNQYLPTTSDTTLSTVDSTPIAPSDTITPPDAFIVPKGIDLTLYTNLSEITFNNHSFVNVGGDITVRDGVIVLKELGFSSNSAEMQLTAIYQTPSRDDLYVGLDFHLLDINIDELISLIPSIDSIVPMLKSFDGEAEFHLAAETNLDGCYMPKMPTLIGAAAIEGKNLVVMDNEVFDGIKRKLLMSRKAENRIDSLSVEMQVLRNKVDLYPFLIHMDKYKAVIGGRHNINKDLDCNYHISLTDCPLPIRLGVNIGGSLNDIAAHPMRHIKLGRCQYKRLYQPDKVGITEKRTLEMKRAISETLKSNVR